MPSSSGTISTTLETLIALARKQHYLSLQDIIMQMDGRVFGVLLLVLALPNTLPIPSPPGLSGVTGIPIFLLSMQLALGRSFPWLPQHMLKYQVPLAWCERVAHHARSPVARMERFLHPRLMQCCTPVFTCLAGAIMSILAILLSLPLPFGNILPSIPVVIISLGLIERDGYFIAAGMLIGIAVSIGMCIFWSQVLYHIIINIF
jgi:hypothetical protein